VMTGSGEANQEPAAASPTSAERPTWEPERFQILSLDGGGLKGIYSAAVLAALEESMGVPIVSRFDLIVGTSTGGIIALGLGLGLSPREILDFYVRSGADVFGDRLKLRSWMRLLRPKYSAGKLAASIREVFGDRLLGESRTALVITAYDLDSDRVYLFKTPHAERFDRDWRVPAWEVAMATSAAPTYFPAFRLRSDRTRLIDGGVWANNPSPIAVAEAVSSFGARLGQIRLFSLGTTSPAVARAKRLDHGGFVYWGLGGLEVLLKGQSEGANSTAFHLLSEAQVLREDPTVPAGVLRMDAVDVDHLVGLASSYSRRLAPKFTSFVGDHAGLELEPRRMSEGPGKL
jgi:predicted acylesterase/phospholipase RssA